MPYYFYIVRCADNSLYSGITTNLEKRIAEHNSGDGKGSKYTRAKRPVHLVYSEQYPDRGVSTRREAEVKKWPKAKKEGLVK